MHVILRSIWKFGALFLLPAMLFSAPAKAEVSVTFYSHDFGDNFPHAFFLVKGQLKNGKAVNGGYGFTAKNISPGILWGKVRGVVKSPSAKYIAKSNRHFTVKVSDAKYQQLMAVVTKWRNIPQKSYSLNKRNCVHFAAEAIRVLGYKTNLTKKNKKKPKTFMIEVMRLNPGLKK